MQLGHKELVELEVKTKMEKMMSRILEELIYIFLIMELLMS